MTDQINATAKAAPKPSILREISVILVSILIGGGLLFGAYLYWQYEGEHPSTDDAYLQANFVWISPRIDGQITEVMVQENQFVKAGAVLFRMDPRPFRATLAKTSSAAELVAQINKIDAAAVVAAEAKVNEQQANLDYARENFERVSKLVERGAEAKLRGIAVADTYKAAKATLEDLKSELDLARKTLGPPEIQQARLDKAQAGVTLAELDLEWTTVSAPTDGWVAGLPPRPGDVVSTADKLFPFVEAETWWVQANFKETTVSRIEPGLTARIEIDLYGDRVFKGTVESLGSASAASFSLLPAQNTTGNWVKVSQRIPVRIRMEPMDQGAPYRLGASCSVEVDTETPPHNAP